MTFLIFNIVIGFILIFLLLLLSMVWPPDSPWAPWWRTNSKTAKAICKLANFNKNDILYDLGCGDGTLLLTAAKNYKIKGVGLEIDPLRYFIARLRVYKNKLSNVSIARKNFFDENISRATVISVYLVPKALERLMPKFKKELKKGTKIVSYKYKMNLSLVAYDKDNELYLYKI